MGPIVIGAVAVLVLFVWAGRHIILSRTQDPSLVIRTDLPVAAGDDTPKVSIIVPAKDEEANIAGCLVTLRAQDYSNIEIIVVDDRSTDGTADIVERLAAADPRIHLVRIAELPQGWFGKTHAMHVGAGEATGRWLLFVDADCRQSPRSVSATLAYTRERQGDMLSLWPLLEMHGVAENLVQPLCGSVLGLWFRPQLVNDPRRKAAFANGQFVLVRREVYDAVGGHASVRDRLVEDIGFARVVKGAGYRLVSAMGFDVFRTRMYTNLRSTWRGWTRIFSGAFLSPWQIVIAMVLVVLMSASPFVLTAVAGAMAVAAGWGDAQLNALAAIGLGQLLVMATVLVRYNRMIRARPGYLVLYPVSVIIVLGILANALAMRLGLTRIIWRGTVYRKNRRISAR
jgi:chlorobactene glucosyltransferase